MPEEDLIFGRNRHLFGGMAPSNMLSFTATTVTGGIQLSYQLPTNTVTGSQVLCTVEGAVIRRKTGSYPVNEFDGVMVKDVKSNGSYIDPISSGTYYYAAFPYSTQGVFNRSKTANRAVGTSNKATAANLTTFSLASTLSDGQPQVNIATILDNQDDISTGVTIRKSKLGYPMSEDDGEFVATTIENDSIVTDTDVSLGETCYYTAFPFSEEDGTYDYSQAKTAEILVTGPLPGEMRVFEAQSIVRYDKPIVKLKVRLPISSPDVEISGVRIYRNDKQDYIYDLAKEAIGDKFWTVIDEDVVAYETYEYTACPYTTNDIFNVSEPDSNKSEVYVNPRWVFGFRYNPEDHNPYTCISYLEDCDNINFIPMNASDFTKWGPIDVKAGEFFFPSPCYLDDQGELVCYLDPNDYDKDEDLNSMALYNNDLIGNMMLEWPTVCVSFHDNEFRISNQKVDDTFETKIEGLYTAIYPTNCYGKSQQGWIMNDLLRSPQAYSNPDITIWSLFTFLYMLLFGMGDSTPPQLALDLDSYTTGIGDKEGLMGFHHFLGMEALTSLTATWVSDLLYIPSLGITDLDGNFIIPENQYGITVDDEGTRYAYADSIIASNKGVLPLGNKGSSSTAPCALAIFAEKNEGTNQHVAMGHNGFLNLRTQATYAEDAQDLPISRICYWRKEDD